MRYLLLAIVAGCAGDFSRLPEQDEAERVVWRGLMGMTEAPPNVEWVRDWELSPGYSGQTLIGWGLRVACGKWDSTDACGMPLSLTAWSHELTHWYCWRTTGDVDAAHSHCDWGMVERAGHAMYSAGMD